MTAQNYYRMGFFLEDGRIAIHMVAADPPTNLVDPQQSGHHLQVIVHHNTGACAHGETFRGLLASLSQGAATVISETELERPETGKEESIR